MKTKSELKKEARDLVVILNSTEPLVDKYPFGNKELTNKVIEFEKLNLIKFSKTLLKWSASK